MAPAWMTASANPAEALRGAGRSTGRRGTWGQKSLVVVQAALSLVLLCAAGLLTRSLNNSSIEISVSTRRTATFCTSIHRWLATNRQARCPYRQLHDNLSAIPGVQQISFSLYSLWREITGARAFILMANRRTTGTPDMARPGCA